MESYSGTSKSSFVNLFYTWTIDHFTYRKHKVDSPVFQDSEEKLPKLHLSISPKHKNDSELISVSVICSPDKNKDTWELYYKLGIIDSQGKRCSIVGLLFWYFNYLLLTKKIVLEENFVELKNYSIANVHCIVREELMENFESYLPENKLTIYFEIRRFLEEKTIPRPIESISEKVKETIENYGSLLRTGKFADFTLVAMDGTEFACHKSILSVRSPYFSGMFQHDTKEKREGRATIANVKTTIIEVILEFIYTGMISKNNIELTILQELMMAADLFQLERLKNICEESLASRLTVESASSLLLLADSINAEKLKHETVKFIDR